MTTRSNAGKPSRWVTRLTTASLDAVPPADAVWQIDVPWFERGERMAEALGTEHSRSIYSGVVRGLDSALGADGDGAHIVWDALAAVEHGRIVGEAPCRVHRHRPRTVVSSWLALYFIFPIMSRCICMSRIMRAW